MRTEKSNRSHHSKSEYKRNIVLTIEEANALADCDPVMTQRLETHLTHSGCRKKGGDEKPEST